jgi:hypothetical protein
VDEDGARRPTDPAEGGKRSLAPGFIAIFLGLQLLIPATYYAGADPADERFSWRMFSMRRAERCQLSAEERGGSADSRPRTLNLSTLIHEGWKSALSRRRSEVIQAFFLWRCEEPGVFEVSLIRACRGATGQSLEPDRLQHICAPGEEAP